MNTLGLSPAEAEDALVVLARHVPPGIVIGQPLIAYRDDDGGQVVIVTTEDAFWFVRPEAAERMGVAEAGADSELIEWRRGLEVSRTAVPPEEGP